MFPKQLITEGQTLQDIQRAMLAVFEADAKYYDAVIDRLQLPASTGAAAARVFDFLKNNCAYKIEPETKQRVMRLPALLHYCGKGIDCKNFALFSAGAMAAHAARYNTGAKVAFKFAGYGRKGIEHVFTTVTTRAGRTYWIDPVLPAFDIRTPAPYLWEQIPVNMALYQIGKVPPASVGFDPLTASLVTSTLTNQQGSGQQGSQQQNQMLQQFGNLLPELLQKNGVSPGFFQRFSFLRVLDNSTGKWKSRAAFLADKTPDERIAFYIEAMQAGEPCDRTVIQYPELYGHQRKPEKGTPDDTGLVRPDLIAVYNALVQSNYLKGAASLKCGRWDYPASYLLLPGSGGVTGSPLAVVSDLLGLSPAAGSNAGRPVVPGARPVQAGLGGAGSLLMLGAFAWLAYSFLKKR